ncbi:MAG: asparagine synthase (glutamine-hydrolyzing) [Bacteroidota bacterium]|nr:asparagine synthase (glutamine-hydrolyzing) [Bacteroidota bacterium]
MCGIVGAFLPNTYSEALRSKFIDCVNLLKHRGPDKQNYYIKHPFLLGHTRLSILDLSDNAMQPMFDNSKRYAIVFNGEIFNYKLLRRQLENKGITFVSNSDTEVLLYLLINEGPSCLNKLNGFFAFAFIDTYKNELLIARDRYGVKPLVYSIQTNELYFASEIKAIKPLLSNSSISKDALNLYFRLNYIPAPLTIYNEIKKLEPGCYLLKQNESITIQKYYSISIDQNVRNSNQNNFLELFESSIQLRLEADVPVGAFLSGGLDSSAIVAVASKHKRDLETFNIGYNEHSFYDESKYAEMVSKKFGTMHNSILLNNTDLYHGFEEMQSVLDEPFADSSALAFYLLSKKTSSKLKVALSGDGADELLGGYNKQLAEYRIQKLKKLTFLLSPIQLISSEGRDATAQNIFRQLKKFYSGSKLSFSERYWDWCGFLKEEKLNQLFDNEYFRNSIYQKIKLQYTQHLDFNNLNSLLLSDMNLVLANDMLFKVDSMSMANGIEIRNPFLDYRLVDYCFSLNSNAKINFFQGKNILRNAFKDILPTEILNRSKKGFEIPVKNLLQNELNEMLEKWVFNKEFIQNQRIFNYNFLITLKTDFWKINSGDSPSIIWALLNFQRWYLSQYLIKKV